jgi:hypothetical protein
VHNLHPSLLYCNVQLVNHCTWCIGRDWSEYWDIWVPVSCSRLPWLWWHCIWITLAMGIECIWLSVTTWLLWQLNVMAINNCWFQSYCSQVTDTVRALFEISKLGWFQCCGIKCIFSYELWLLQRICYWWTFLDFAASAVCRISSWKKYSLDY